MDICLSLPSEIQPFIEAQVAAQGYGTVDKYFLALVQQDRRHRSQEYLEVLLLEGINSGDVEDVTLEFWQQLRSSVLKLNAAEEHPQA